MAGAAASPGLPAVVSGLAEARAGMCWQAKGLGTCRKVGTLAVAGPEQMQATMECQDLEGVQVWAKKVGVAGTGWVAVGQALVVAGTGC